MKKASVSLAIVLTLLGAGRTFAVPTLTAMTTWGNGDGWRAPKETVGGDVAGTGSPGAYTFLSVTNSERGIAYNPTTGNVLLVSRPTTAGALVAAATAPAVRVLNGTTGADIGGFNVSGISGGGGGLLNKIGVTTDGVIYADNISTTPTAASSGLRIYRWSSESAALTTGSNTAPTLALNPALAETRVGDTFDVFGADASVSFVVGDVNSTGYTTITGGTPTTINTITGAAPVPGSNSFGRGITFGANASTIISRGNDSNIWFTTAAGAKIAAPAITLGRQPMDYIEIQGIPYLALVDIATTGATSPAVTNTSTTNRPNVYVYKIADPANPVLVASGSTVPVGVSVANVLAGTTAPISTAGGNGQVAWGGTVYVNDQPVTPLYVLSTNQGIQAFNFQVDSVPEASSFLVLGLVSLVAGGAAWIRRKRSA